MLEHAPCEGELFTAESLRAAHELLLLCGKSASSLYIECRLGGQRPSPTDLLVAIASCDSEALERSLRRAGDLDSVAQFCSAWNHPDSLVYHHASAIWLEFDDVVGWDAARPPSFSTCLIPGYGDSRDPLRKAADPDAELELMSAVIAAARGEPPSQHERDNLIRLSQALPDAGRFIHLSVMSGRPQQPIKLYGVLPRGQIYGYLREAGWRGPMEELRAVVEGLCPPERVGDELYVDLTVHDFDAPLGSRIGFVFSPQHLRRSSEADAERGPLLASLVARNLCTPAQSRELRRWPQRYKIRERKYDDGPVMVNRWLDIKVVWERGHPLAAKAYLGLSVRPARPFE